MERRLFHIPSLGNIVGCWLLVFAVSAVSARAGADVVKGNVAQGKLADYERGATDWPLLLKDYQRYGLMLPAQGSELVAVPREIWVIEPLRVWHLGFALPPHPREPGEKQMRRYLIGAESFTSGVSKIRVMDRVLADGTIEKSPQFEPDKLVKKWDGKKLEEIDFIFHGQDKAELDSNALFMTAIQLRILRDERAARLMDEALRFDVDIWDYWQSDFVQPAGWTTRHILAECAWRFWVNRWFKGEDRDGEVLEKLRLILPQVAAPNRGEVALLIEQIDPGLSGLVADGSLAGSVIEFGLKGGDWSQLVKRAKADPQAFDVLLAMLGDGRVLPYRDGADDDFECELESRRSVRVWYRRDRFRRISDYAALLLNEICDRALMGSNGTATDEFMVKYRARAEFRKLASGQKNPRAYVRSNWFIGTGKDRRLNLPAIELQAGADFEELVEKLPDEFGVVRSDGVEDLSRIVAFGHELFAAALDLRKLSAERRLRIREMNGLLFKKLYERSQGNSAGVRAILLRMVLPYSRSVDDEIPAAVAELLGKISEVPEPIETSYADCDAAAVAESLTRSGEDLVWQPFLEKTRAVPPGLAIEWLGRVLEEKSYSDHPSRDQQWRYGFALLDDLRVRDLGVEPWRFEGATARDFTKLRVGDYAALMLGRKLKLPWSPGPTWDDEQWMKFRARVRAAVLRFDAQHYRGLINRR